MIRLSRKHLRRSRALAVATSLLALSACWKEAGRPPEAEPSTRIGEQPASDATPAAELLLGTRFAGDPRVSLRTVQNEFAAGDECYASLELARDPAGPLAIELRDAEGTVLAAQQARLSDGRFANFACQLPPRLLPGTYQMVAFVADQQVAARELAVVERFRSTPPYVGSNGQGELGYALIDVYYATDRAVDDPTHPERAYGAARSADRKLHLGVCQVSVPRDERHRIGQIERPSLWKLELSPDPEKHMLITSFGVLPEEIFYRRLSRLVAKSDRRQALVFVHGFKNTFSDAVLRTAQLAYDLGFDGVPIAYSWPSRGALSLTDYHADEATIEWTIPQLEAFLLDLARRSGAEEIHLVAHSMGNRALTRALKGLAVRVEADLPLFDEVVLTAPDDDSDVFAELVRDLAPVGERTTLYASSKDLALAFSRSVHGDLPRAGDSEPGEMLVLAEAETIDVSDVDTSLVGHRYFGDNRSVLRDLHELLADRDPPDERFGLRRREQRGLPFWVFRP